MRVYDSLGRVISKHMPGIGLSTYLYDMTLGMPSGHLGQRTTDPEGNVTTKIYDRSGRLYQVISGAGTTTYAYYDNGNRQSMAYPNGVTAQYTYYADNRLHTLANMRGGTYLSTFNYVYDGNGNMTAKLELKGMTLYQYDALGRLMEVAEPDGRATAYTFDATGNRLTETVTVDNSVTITVYSYNGQNRLLSTTDTLENGDEKISSFYYDYNGSQVSMLVSMISGDNGDAGFGLAISGVGDDEATYELSGYDAFGRLVSVLDDNNTAEYSYNADGLRISKDVTTCGVTESARFLYEGGYITLELDGAGDHTAYKVYGGESIITRTTAQGVDFYLYNGTRRRRAVGGPMGQRIAQPGYKMTITNYTAELLLELFFWQRKIPYTVLQDKLWSQYFV